MQIVGAVQLRSAILFEEARLAERRIIVAVVPGQAAHQAFDRLDRGGDAAIGHRLLAVGAHQRQVVLDVVHQVRQIVAEDHPFGGAHGRHHADLHEIGDFQRPAKGFFVQGVGAAQGLRPVADQRTEHQARECARLQIGTPPGQRHRHRAEVVAARHVAVVQHQHQRVADIGDGAEIAVPPLHRQARHRHHHQRAEILLAGVIAGHPQALHHLHRGHRVRRAHVAGRQQGVGRLRARQPPDIGEDVVEARLHVRDIVRNGDVQLRQAFALHGDGVEQAALQLILVRLDGNAAYLQQRVQGAGAHQRIDRLGGIELPAQVSRFGRAQLQVEPEVGVDAPRLCRQQAQTNAHVLQRGLERGRASCLDAGLQIERRQLHALVRIVEQRTAGVELFDDLEQCTILLLRRGMPQQQAADAKMVGRAGSGIGDHVGCLLHPVVQEAVMDAAVAGAGVAIDVFIAFVERLDQSCLQRRPQGLLRAPGRAVHCQRKGVEREAVAAGGGQLQQVLRCGGQAVDFLQQHIDHVVGIFDLLYRGQVPVPAIVGCAVAQVARLIERSEELVEEKGIAGRLGVANAGQWRAVRRRHAHGGRDHLRNLRFVQGVQKQRGQAHLACEQLVAQRDEGVRGAHFVVAVRADEQQAALVAGEHEQLDHPQRGRIGPLQVVQEQHQRMPGAGEDFDEAGEQAVQAQLGLCRRRRGHRVGGADDQRQLGNQFDQHADAIAQGAVQFSGPLPQRCFGLAQQLAHQPLEGLDQRGIRDVALQLVKLAGQETAAPGDDRFLHLVDDRRLADA